MTNNVNYCRIHRRIVKRIYYQTPLADLFPTNIIISPRDFGKNMVYRQRAIKASRYQYNRK
jgi:hypothetical protein